MKKTKSETVTKTDSVQTGQADVKAEQPKAVVTPAKPIPFALNVKYTGTAPVFGTKGASCADLFVAEDMTIPRLSVAKIPTGTCIELPKNTEAEVRPRSSTLQDKGLIVIIGTIDEDYRGEIKVQVFNPMPFPVVIVKGERLAQLAVRERKNVQFIKVEALSETERGTKGFGSTGA